MHFTPAVVEFVVKRECICVAPGDFHRINRNDGLGQRSGEALIRRIIIGVEFFARSFTFRRNGQIGSGKGVWPASSLFGSESRAIPNTRKIGGSDQGFACYRIFLGEFSRLLPWSSEGPEFLTVSINDVANKKLVAIGSMIGVTSYMNSVLSP